MSLWRLIRREIRFRSLNFCLSIVSILVASGCVVGAVGFLKAHDARIVELSEKKKKLTEKLMREHENFTRKNMLKLGFNVWILPEKQDRVMLRETGVPDTYMPESYVSKLSESRIATINHLLPTLQERLFWKELERAIHVVGTRGEVPFSHRTQKKPLIDVVPRDHVILGYELARRYQEITKKKLAKGDTIDLTLIPTTKEGKLPPLKFKVLELYPKRGNRDDITMWVNLAQFQELVDKKGQINAILALGCHCAPGELHRIRADISELLPKTQVIEDQAKLLVRAEQRMKAAKQTEKTLQQEVDQQVELKHQHENLASMLVPLVLLGCIVWLGILAFANVRDRVSEIGILRAIGLRSRQVFAVFLTKAALVGLVGGLLGYLAGLGLSMLWAGSMDLTAEAVGFDPLVLLLVLIGAPLLGVVAGWIPALWAARQDPASVLQQE